MVQPERWTISVGSLGSCKAGGTFVRRATNGELWADQRASGGLRAAGKTVCRGIQFVQLALKGGRRMTDRAWDQKGARGGCLQAARSSNSGLSLASSCPAVQRETVCGPVGCQDKPEVQRRRPVGRSLFCVEHPGLRKAQCQKKGQMRELCCSNSLSGPTCY